MGSRLVTIDERFCVTVQAISPVQEIGISHVHWAVFVIEPYRQQAIVIQCLFADRVTHGVAVIYVPQVCPFLRFSAERAAGRWFQ